MFFVVWFVWEGFHGFGCLVVFFGFWGVLWGSFFLGIFLLLAYFFFL